MRLEGSKTAYIECSKCDAKSPNFRVFLYTDQESNEWDGKWDGALPEGWQVEEEAELITDEMIIGLCPKHKEANE